MRPRFPGLVVLFSRDRFTLVQVTRADKGNRPTLTQLQTHALPTDGLIPRPDKPNLARPAEAALAVGRALERIPGRAKLGAISVILPDSSALVSLLTLRNLPRSSRQASEVIRWQVRNRVPFRLDDARIHFQRFGLDDGSERVLVAVARESVISQYEQMIASLGLQPGLVDLSTLNLANLVLQTAEDSRGDLAVLNLTEDRLSVLILRERIPLFFRSKIRMHGMDVDPAAARREIQRELASSIAYYRERLAGSKTPVAHAYLRSVGADDGSIEAVMADTLGVRPQHLDPAASVDMSQPAAPDDLQRAAPALGVLVGT
ncbi:MAG: type IV pilus biogenesis protein PilM [Acidobacteriota bacterium]